ncbi:MAG: hypothetical protein ACWA47_01260 [Brevirhabdus sp.]
MVGEQLLQWFWSGLVECDEARSASPFVCALRSRAHVQVVSLLCPAVGQSPIVLSESHEVTPGVTIGDVLHEELDVFVAAGGLVVFEPVSLDGDSAAVEPDAWSSSYPAMSELQYAMPTDQAVVAKAANRRSRFHAATAPTHGVYANSTSGPRPRFQYLI